MQSAEFNRLNRQYEVSWNRDYNRQMEEHEAMQTIAPSCPIDGDPDKMKQFCRRCVNRICG